MHRFLLPLVAVLALDLAGVAAADEPKDYVVVIEGHRFQPAELQVPAGEPILLVIENHDATPEEFESDDLRREKVIPGNGKASIRIDPLAAGEYSFIGEFNPDSARGKLVVK